MSRQRPTFAPGVGRPVGPWIGSIVVAWVAALLVSGCAGSPERSSTTGSTPTVGSAESVSRPRGGGYYQNDGPPDDEDIDIDAIADAVPRREPLSRYGNPDDYEALGKRYYVLASSAGFSQTGRASWYGRQFHGRRTSSGEPYDMFKMTAAHKRLPIPSYVRVTNLDNDRRIVVRVNDRGPFREGRIIDLSYVAARKLGIVRHGSAPVHIETVTPESLAAERRAPASVPARPAARRSAPASSPARAVAVADRGQLTASGLYLQAGAFSSPGNARQLHGRLRAAGMSQVDVIEPAGDEGLYRVRIGPYDTAPRRSRDRERLAVLGFSTHPVSR